MKQETKSTLFMALFVILMTLIITAVCVVPAFAQDEMPPEEPPVEEPVEEMPPEESSDFPDWTTIPDECIGNCETAPEFIVEGCVKYPLALNWLGTQEMWEGWTMIDDGSCFCMDYNDEVGAYEVPCEKSNGSFMQMLVDEGIVEWQPWMPSIIAAKPIIALDEFETEEFIEIDDTEPFEFSDFEYSEVDLWMYVE